MPGGERKSISYSYPLLRSLQDTRRLDASRQKRNTDTDMKKDGGKAGRKYSDRLRSGAARSRIKLSPVSGAGNLIARTRSRLFVLFAGLLSRLMTSELRATRRARDCARACEGSLLPRTPATDQDYPVKSSIDARSTSFEQNDASSRLVLFLEVDRIKERTTWPEFTIVNPYLDSRLYARCPRSRSSHMHNSRLHKTTRTVRSMISFHPSEPPSSLPPV